MNFRCIRGSVGCVLLVVALLSAALGSAITNSTVSTTPKALVVIVDEPIKRPVASSDNLMAGVPVIVATNDNPLIREDCRVYLAAYGLDDPTRYGYVETTFGGRTNILIPSDPCANRGVTLFELDPTTCTVRNRERFDTYPHSTEIPQLVEYMESATTGTIIVAVTADCVDYNGGPNLATLAVPFFTRYNMDLSGVGFREKFAFVLQKGYPKKSVYQKKVRGEDSIRMTIALSGYTVRDVLFSQL